EGTYNFAFGLASFLVVQVCYILFFYRTKSFAKKNASFLFVATLLILGYLVIMNYVFWPKVYYQNFIGPVVAYSFALGLMLLCAVNISNSKRFNKSAVYYFIPGAVSFVASDSMIAANRFYFPPTRPLADYYTLGTYCLAQFLIVMGAIQVIRRKK
ncbi:MAG TPA: lysoplasmalogenase, partial [Parafilimonas sp.]|nr:lysoplasmalogenase [Parafilimonas sp.]